MAMYVLFNETRMKIKPHRLHNWQPIVSIGDGERISLDGISSLECYFECKLIILETFSWSWCYVARLPLCEKCEASRRSQRICASVR